MGRKYNSFSPPRYPSLGHFRILLFSSMFLLFIYLLIARYQQFPYLLLHSFLLQNPFVILSFITILLCQIFYMTHQNYLIRYHNFTIKAMHLKNSAWKSIFVRHRQFEFFCHAFTRKASENLRATLSKFQQNNIILFVEPCSYTP